MNWRFEFGKLYYNIANALRNFPSGVPCKLWFPLSLGASVVHFLNNLFYPKIVYMQSTGVLTLRKNIKIVI